jgi:hypothetical protein
MNDPGLEQPIQDTAKSAQHNMEKRDTHNGSRKEHGIRAAFRKELQEDEEEEEVGYFQPKFVFFQWPKHCMANSRFSDVGGSPRPHFHLWRERLGH